jgi:hypothetical protein
MKGFAAWRNAQALLHFLTLASSNTVELMYSGTPVRSHARTTWGRLRLEYVGVRGYILGVILGLGVID